MEEIVSRLNKTLTGLKIKATCVSAKVHRHILTCNIEPELGQKFSKIENSLREIGSAMKAEAAPTFSENPKNGTISLQFAMSEASILDFDELYKSNTRPKGIMQFLLGESGDGSPMWVDMALNPHMLVAGGTGSGKSTLLHVLIENSLRRDDVNLYLSDPKNGVEFGVYEGTGAKIANSYEETLKVLENLHDKMEKRYATMKNLGIKSIEQNTYAFPKCLLIIDEVADLMIKDQDKKNPDKGRFEELVCAIAQKSRAAGIYMVMATQRPSTDVITGLIKANFPARLACRVSSATDSKVILDSTGAEKLLGRGDAILDNVKNNNVRFQVAYVDPEKRKEVAA